MTAAPAAGGGGGATFSYAGKTGTIASDGTTGYTWDPPGTTLIASGTPGATTGKLALTDVHGNQDGQFTPAATALTGSRAYDPWGVVTATTGAVTGQLGYQSAWAGGPGSGNDLMGARWYNPANGSFTSADTTQVPQTPDPAAANPYAYAGDNPLTGIDPTGHMRVNLGGSGTPAPEAIGGNACIANVGACLQAAGLITESGKIAPPAASAAVNAAERAAEKTAAAGGTPDQVDNAANAAAAAARKQATPRKTNNPRDKPPPPRPVAPPKTIQVGPVTLPATYPHARQILADYQAFLPGFIASPAGFGDGYTVKNEFAALAALCGGANKYNPRLFTLCGRHLVLELFAAEGSQYIGAAFGDLGGLDMSERTSLEGDMAGEEEVASFDRSMGWCPGGNSFTPATPVLLADRKTAPIAALKPGDKVLAYNPKTGKDQPETITTVEVNHDTNLYNLKIKTAHGTQVIHTTSNHLFYDPYLDHGWIPANHLKSGMHLKTPDGQSAVVVGGSTSAVHDGWMWDLTVPGNNDHDFYVEPTAVLSPSRAGPAAVAVLVHNESCPTARFAVGADGTTEDLANDLLHPGGSPIGVAGSNPGIREIGGDLSDAQALFDELSQGGKVVADNGKLTRVELPNGEGFVQLRTVMSRSPNSAATIDINMPGVSDIDKLKFNP